MLRSVLTGRKATWPALWPTTPQTHLPVHLPRPGDDTLAAAGREGARVGMVTTGTGQLRLRPVAPTLQNTACGRAAWSGGGGEGQQPGGKSGAGHGASAGRREVRGRLPLAGVQGRGQPGPQASGGRSQGLGIKWTREPVRRTEGKRCPLIGGLCESPVQWAAGFANALPTGAFPRPEAARLAS